MGNAKAINSKKQKSDIWYTVIAVVLVVMLIAGLLVAILKPTGIADYISLHTRTALSSENYSVNNAQMTYLTYATYSNYYSQYSSYASDIGMDTSLPLDQQKYYGSTTKSWRDFCVEEATSTLTQVLVLCEAAKANGFELTEDDKSNIADVIQSIKDYAKKNNQSVKTTIANLYGSKGISLNDIEKLLELQYIASGYVTKLTDAFSYTEEQYNTYYGENKIDYLYADYYTYTMKASYATGATDAEKEAATTAIQAKADELMQRIANGENFIDVIYEYEQELAAADKKDSDDAEDTDDTAETKAVEEQAAKDKLESSCLKTEQTNGDTESDKWIFGDTNPEKGTTKLIKGTENATTYQIVTPAHRQDYKSSTIRELYLSIDNFKDSAEMEAYAKTIVAAYDALTEKTSDNFGKLAEQFTTVDDNGDAVITVTDSDRIEEATKSTSSDYTDVNEWLFSEDRTAGDVKYFLVSDDSIEIYFFEEFGRATWLLAVDSDMRTDDYNKEYDTLKEQYAVTTNDKAIAKVAKS